jgi:hypothetical protein
MYDSIVDVLPVVIVVVGLCVLLIVFEYYYLRFVAPYTSRDGRLIKIATFQRNLQFLFADSLIAFRNKIKDEIIQE